METKAKIGIISVLLTLCFVLPISLYITYVLLKSAGVDRLVWFLYIINIPVMIVIHILTEVMRGK